MLKGLFHMKHGRHIGFAVMYDGYAAILLQSRLLIILNVVFGTAPHP